MTGTTRFIRKLAYANMLANDRLHEAVSQLEPGEFEAARTSFFPSLVATLNHILIIDWFYIDALEGGDLGPKAWANQIPFPDRADLRAARTFLRHALPPVRRQRHLRGHAGRRYADRRRRQ